MGHLALWVSVACFAHAFAAVFLVRSMCLARPQLTLGIRRKARRLCACFRGPGHQDGAKAAADAGVADGSFAYAHAAPYPTVAPATLQWFDVGCTYRTPDGHKIVLQGAFGSAGPGDMVALLGPSGSGKTTLLDILALRKTVGDVTGRMMLNGKPYTRRTCGHMLAYVPQEEVFPPSMTCEEVLQYWAALALPASMTQAQRQQRIAEVLAAVGLTAQAKTLVGGALPGGLMLRGLSGGERKRLAVATGLLERPPLIFLDEPTTGLDSHSALNVMQHLSAMAAAGHTIIASIHQPRAQVWALFTHVVVVSQGLMIYSGPRRELVPWITQTLGYGPFRPERHGMAADFVMDLVNVGFRKPARFFGQTMLTVEDLGLAASRFMQQHRPRAKRSRSGSNGALGRQASDLASADHAAPVYPASDPPGVLPGGAAGEADRGAAGGCWGCWGGKAKGKGEEEEWEEEVAVAEEGDGGGGVEAERNDVGWLRQMWTLAWREVLLVTRNPADVAGRSLIFCWVGLFTGLVFYSPGESLSSIRPYTYALFVEVTAFSLLPYIYMSLHTADKRFFVADSAAGLYPPSAYYAAKVLVNLPFSLFNILTLALIVYGMVGLSTASAHAEWGSPMLEHMVIASLGYLVAAQVLHFAALIAGSQDAGFMVAIAWTALNMLVSNTLLRFDVMTMHWVASLRYISSQWYVIGGLARAQFANQAYSCDGGLASPRLVEQLMPELLPNDALLRNQLVQQMILNPGGECTINGEQVIDYLGATQLSSWLICVCLAAYLVVVHVLTYLALLLTQRRDRK